MMSWIDSWHWVGNQFGTSLSTHLYQILMISDNVEFLAPIFYAVFWQPFWKWQTSRKFWKRRIAPLMVTYHYVKFYVSIIIYLEVIILNWFLTSKNFYRSPFSKWPSQYRTNSTLSDFNDISYVGRLWCPELIPDIESGINSGHHYLPIYIKFWWYRTMLNF
jgi:hypothetical protein